jgi:uncharacterized protein
MGGVTAAFLIVAAFLTAMLSGIFGMAGGLVLMGALALVLPVSAAFVTHGILQLVANGWRAVLHRRHVQWAIIGWYALASSLAAGLVAAIAFVPSKPVLFILLGLVPMLVWLPKGWLSLDASRPRHAFAAGIAVTGLNLTAGVAGPLLDTFFVRTTLSRHEIVATKAAMGGFTHMTRIIIYGAPLLGSGTSGVPPWWLFAIAIPASMIGTVTGGRFLDMMSDVNFKRWTAWIVTGIGIIYLVQGINLLPPNRL